jgi:hypothetical protein
MPAKMVALRASKRRIGSSKPVLPALLPLRISSANCLAPHLFARFSRLQNFVADLQCVRAAQQTAAARRASHDRATAADASIRLSALLRHRLVMDHLVVMMVHRVLHDVMVVVMTVMHRMLHHVMVVDNMVMMMVLHDHLRRDGGGVGAAGGEHRAGESDRNGNADGGQDVLLHWIDPRIG